jgi:hypothetical protein
LEEAKHVCRESPELTAVFNELRAKDNDGGKGE